MSLDSHVNLFHIPVRFRAGESWNLVEKLPDWERLLSLASELISPRIQIDYDEEDDEITRNFTAPVALAYRLSAGKQTHCFGSI